MISLFLSLLFFFVSTSSASTDVSTGLSKKPIWATTHDADVGVPMGKEPADNEKEDTTPASTPTEPTAPAPPPHTLSTLTNAVDFIQHQRGMGGHGLPATFYVPSSTVISDPLRHLIITEGCGVYDTALAVIVLVEAGEIDSAREILNIFVDGTYASANPNPLDLAAYPNSNNSGAFKPFSDDVRYFFDFTNVYGDWFRWGDRWKFWGTHTGPNAWLVNALLRTVDAARRKGVSESDLAPYLTLADHLGEAMIRLQDDEAEGGVRYGPENDYHDDDTTDPHLMINSENNVSAYAAFRMLAEETQDPQFTRAADRILSWFESAPTWTSDGHPHKGLINPQTSTLAMGAEWKDHRWVLQDDHPTDSAGTWTISSLGPALIDHEWGAGTAYKMWRTVRQRSGRTPDFSYSELDKLLAGLDYNDAFPPNESLISPEWSAGGLFALKALVEYYGRGTGRGVLTAAQLLGLKQDAASMTDYIGRNPNPYALGPGFQGQRQGRTGFHWFCPPMTVTAMASVYYTLYAAGKSDPLAWHFLRHEKSNASTRDKQKQEQGIFNPFPSPT